MAAAAPIGFAAGLGAPAAPPQAPPPGALPVPPSPREAPELWASITLGAYSFPPVPLQDATVELEVDSTVRLDQQKASGKSKSKTKVNGKDNGKAKLKLSWTEAIWQDACAFSMAIDPNGVNDGGPFVIQHPEAQRRGLKRVMVKKAGAVKMSLAGGLFSQEFEIEEWTDPSAAAEPGETDTPATAFVPSYGTPTIASAGFATTPTSFGGAPTAPTSFGGAPTAPSGFAGPSAPKAGP